MVQLRHTLLLSTAFFSSLAIASPALQTRQNGIQKLSTSDINSYNPFSYFAAAAYCTPAQTNLWDCGTNCNANPDFITQASGGDGNNNPYWYVGYDKSTGSIIIGYQGSSAQTVEREATGNNAELSRLDANYFTGIPENVRANAAFQALFESSANAVLQAVRKVLDDKNTKTITIVGHGRGAAIALLSSIFVKNQINDNTINIRTITYALPRVGNQAFADYIDKNVGTFAHINNKEDPVPQLPPRNQGYVQPSGEIHIQDNNAWVACSGQDNTSDECSAGDPNPTNVADYPGPYNGVTMTC